MFKQVVELRKEVLGPEHADTLAVTRTLAIALEKMEGRSKEAEALYRSVLEARTKALGAKHVDTIAAMW